MGAKRKTISLEEQRQRKFDEADEHQREKQVLREQLQVAEEQLERTKDAMVELLHRNPREQELYRELQALDRDAEARKKVLKKQNKGFTQVYEKGWERMRMLTQQNKSAAALYAFIAQHCDSDGGALTASQEALCEEIGISRTTLWRASNYLEEIGALVRIQVGNSVYAYALDPTEIWKAWDTQKESAVFRTKTLARKADNGAVRRKMKIMLNEKRGEPELPLESDEG